MTREQFLNSMDEVVELPPGTLKGTENLCELEQWDSLAMIRFIALADSNNRVSLSPRQLLSCMTVSDLLHAAKVDP
jgi:acyl carrier protein